MNTNRIDLVTGDLFDDIFATLDAEIDVDGDTASKAATAAEMAMTAILTADDPAEMLRRIREITVPRRTPEFVVG